MLLPTEVFCAKIRFMPSFPHELPLELFRQCPELVLHLLGKVLEVELPPYREVRIEEAHFTEVKPTEYRADLVLTLWNGGPVMCIVVEVQLQIDPRKEWTFPVYVTTARARHQCPTVLLVFSDDERVVRWAQKPIQLGGGSVLRVMAMGPEMVPWVREVEQAVQLPELAVLSAVSHGNEEAGLEVLVPALAALLTLDGDRKNFYYDVVLRSLNEAMRRALEAEMLTRKYEYQSDFARTYFGQGEAKGLAEGEVKGEARALLAVLAARGLEVDMATRERIVGCADPGLLERWITRAATASSLPEIFAEA